MKLLFVIALLLYCSSVFAQATNPISTSPTSSIIGGTGCNTGVSTKIQKGNGAGGCADAVSGTDYQVPIVTITIPQTNAYTMAQSTMTGMTFFGAL